MNKHKHKEQILTYVVWGLLAIIAVMGFFIGRMTATGGVPGYEDLEITVISDVRDTSGSVDQILAEIKKVPSIAGAEIEEKQFSDKGIKELLEKNNINTLPAFIFSTNNFDVTLDPVQNGQNGQPTPKINSYLQQLPDGGFMLPVNATFNPNAIRSAKGNLQLAEGVLDSILEQSYIQGNKDAKFLWLEYSDLECPYCAKLHNDGTIQTVQDKYPNEVQVVFNHFPLNFHKNAETAAQALECIGKENGVDAYYEAIEGSYTTYSNNNFDLEGFYDLAAEIGVNKTKLKACVSSGDFKQKVLDQMAFGTKQFGVTGTPGNVIINTQTSEYAVLSGAVPASAVEQVIEKLK